MKEKYFLGIDIGASSGRHILGYKKGENWVLEEIHRFPNSIIDQNGQKCWDIDGLYLEVVSGIKKCIEAGKQPDSIAINTWGCDFVMLGQDGEIVGNSVSYRDKRVDGMMEKVFQKIPKEEIYRRTGIQFQPFNTLYQLYAMKQQEESNFLKAKHFLMIPDYLIYRLTGKMQNEFTNATTTQMVNAVTGNWDYEMLEKLGIPSHLFFPFTENGQVIAKAIAKQWGGNEEEIIICQCASHDTASAFAGAKLQEEIILSSGTWSLIGCIIDKPMLSDRAMQCNFTNEGHVHKKYRFLKNIMGLWMIQELQKCLDYKYSFPEMVTMARKANDFFEIDVNLSRFLNPQNMLDEIANYSLEKYNKKPQSIESIINSVFHSLAQSYARAITELEEILGRSFQTINIVGGGCKNQYLNELTEKYSGKEIIVGPSEATVIGNIRVQMEGMGYNG